MNETTPVTLLTGGPGAGKTTLLRHWLRAPSLARAAVLLDGDGATGLEDSRVRTLAGRSVPLHIGCSCCLPRGGLIEALRAMLPRARRGDISRIFLEASGGASPVSLMAALTRDPVIVAAYHLDAVIGVIEATRGAQELDDQGEARRWVELCDRIVISKADLADPIAARDRIRRLRPDVPVIDSRNGAAPVDFVLQVSPTFRCAGTPAPTLPSGSSGMRRWQS